MPDTKAAVVDNPDDMELLDSVLPDDYEEEGPDLGDDDAAASSEPDEPSEDDSDEDIDETEELETTPLKTTYSAIKEKYPTIFKDFPELKSTFFKGQEYEKLFPTIDDAKETLSDVDAYVSLRESAMEGNPELILAAMQESDKESFERFSLNFLQTLYSKDQAVYGDVVARPIQNILRYAYEEGVKLIGRGHEDEGKNYQNAAKLIADLIFGDAGAADGSKNFVKTPTKPTESPEETQAAFKETLQEVNDSITKDMSAAIRRGLDPNGAMTPFLRKTVIRNVIDQVAKDLAHDVNWMNAQKSRWARAKREGYDDSSKRKIINAYLARAKDLIPTVRRKVVAEAMGVASKSGNKKVQTIEKSTPRTKEVLNGRVPKQGGRVIDGSRQIDYSKTSDEDILNGRITYKN